MSLKEEINKLYWKDGLTQEAIGKMYGKSHFWVHEQMKKYNIPTRESVDIKTRFLYYVKIPENPNDCWEWIGAKNPDGYGNFGFNGKTMKAHRVSYKIFKRESDPTLFCLHKCDNTSCVNPNHLFLGTQKDNMNDRNQKGRGRPVKGEQIPQSKLTEEKVRKIKTLLIQGKSCVEIGRLFKVSNQTINSIKHNRIWKHIGG